MALQDNVEKFEKNHGEVPLPGDVPMPPNFGGPTGFA
jgi:hypothetical protein